MLLRDGWTGWAVRKRFPAKPMHIALYLQYLANTVKSKSATSVAVNALAWAHRMAGMESPTENSLVRTVVDALDRELFLAMIKSIGLAPKEFGLHSLRSGGATAAANAGVPDRLFKRHGRWKSELAKDGYVKDLLSSRLLVSKSLGV